MRILILIDDYLPSTKSGAKMIHELGLQFLRQGNEVIVLTPSPAIGARMEVSEEHGLQVVRVRTEKLKGVSKLCRALAEIRLSEKLWRRAGAFLRANRCDLIVYYSPTIFWGALVRRLKSLWSCPSYLILRDIFPKWAVDVGVLRKGLPYWYFRHKELAQYRAADVIGVESPGNLGYFSGELGEKRFRIEVLPNWTSANSHDTGRSGYRRQLQLENKVVFFYGGNIGVAQDIDNIVRLANSLQGRTDIFFLLIGEGSEVARLNRLILDLGLRNIKILPAVPQEQYFAMLHEFDVGIMSLHRHLTSHNIPGKLLGYISCAKPVLASVNPGNDIRRILEEAGAGLCCVNGDDEGLRDAALRLANDSKLRETMGRNSRLILETQFSDRVIVEQILNHFRSSSASAEIPAYEHCFADMANTD